MEEETVVRTIGGFLGQFLYKEERPRYGYIDRIASAYRPEVVETALVEALREAHSERRKYWIPDRDTIEEFIKLCDTDLRYARRAAILAFGYVKAEEQKSEGDT